MGDELLSILMLDSIEHIEEVNSRWQLALGHRIWKVLHEPGILLHKWPKGVYTQLIIKWNIDGFELITGNEALLVFEDKL